MSTAEWFIHGATRSAWNVPGGYAHFAVKTEEIRPREVVYVLTFTRELGEHEERMARVRAGKPVPRLVRIAMRNTWAEVDTLARTWERQKR